MQVSALKTPFRIVVVTVGVLLVGLFHAYLAEAGGECPVGFQPGTDAWGVQGCINVTYQCPSGGSWCVKDKKCDCLPATPIWDNQHKVCLASGGGGLKCPPGKINLRGELCWPAPPNVLTCPKSVTYWDPKTYPHGTEIKHWCGVLCDEQLPSQCWIDIGKVLACSTGGVSISALTGNPVVGTLVSVSCNGAAGGVAGLWPDCALQEHNCRCGCVDLPRPKNNPCKDQLGRPIC
jgi:hypothetical protein